MPEATWGTATAKASGGESDPNVLSLKEANRIRIVQPLAVKWRQHFVESSKDPDQGRFVVCPRGPDGRGGTPCPLCMKPVDANGKQRFTVSRRFATNVWDYESESVKVLIAGPQVFEEFDAAAALGLNPMEADYLIHKMGQRLQTSYKVVRGDSAPLSVQIGPDQLHDLSKYDTPTSTDKIFEVLEEMGLDFDTLETPSYTLDEAEAFQMPYGKNKGLTVEQLVANDADYASYIHRSKKEQGAYGDPVFVALQVVLEDRGLAEPLDDAPSAPPRAAQSTPAPTEPSTPTQAAPVASGTVTLVGPDGLGVEVPAAARDAMLKAGYTEPPTGPEPATDEAGNYLLTKDGVQVAVPEVAVEAMLGQGYVRVFQGQPTATPDPAPVVPGPDEEVQVKLNAVPNPIAMPFGDAHRLVSEGQATFVDTDLAAAVDKLDDKGVAQETAAAAAADPTQPAGPDLDPNLTTQNAEGRWTHPALDKDYAAKGGVTAALNRLREKQPTAPTQAATNGSAGASGKEAKLEVAKNLLAKMPEIQSDFKKLMELFAKVANKRNIMEFTESELDALITELEGELATTP